MALNIGELQVHYSGGSTNETPALSLGGAISTAAGKRVPSQSSSPSSGVNITGITIDDAYSNAVGTGTLRWDATVSPGQMSWKPFGAASYSAGVEISADGVYAIGDANGYVVITATFASMPSSGTTTDDLTISDQLEKTFDNVSAQESLDGLVEYRCFYIKNTNSTTTAQDVTIWIEQQPTGPDELDISAAITPTANDTAMGPLADETDSGGILQPGTNIQAWSRPSTQATGINLGNLAAGEYVYFWERRTVSAQTTQKALTDKSIIGISAVSA